MFIGLELRSWLFYFSLPVLYGVLPDPFLSHLSYFVAGLHILSSSSLTTEALSSANQFLSNFYEEFDQLYGKLHVHNYGNY